MFCSLFSEKPELYFTHLQYECIYYIFGCAARAVDARFPTQRLRGSRHPVELGLVRITTLKNILDHIRIFNF